MGTPRNRRRVETQSEVATGTRRTGPHHQRISGMLPPLVGRLPGRRIEDVRVPIACSLSAEGAQAQLNDWSELLARATVGGRRTSPTELAFGLAEDPIHLLEVVALARREKACCPFFRFSIELDVQSIELRISVPAAAAAVLDEFQAKIGP